jgi:hypothetical protein
MKYNLKTPENRVKKKKRCFHGDIIAYIYALAAIFPLPKPK